MTMLRTICFTLRQSDITYEESNTLLSCRIVERDPRWRQQTCARVRDVCRVKLSSSTGYLVSFVLLDWVNDLSMTQVLTSLLNTTIIYLPSWMLQKTKEFIWMINSAIKSPLEPLFSCTKEN